MSQDDKKLYFYINTGWLKAFLKLIVIVIIPYNLVMLLLWKQQQVFSCQQQKKPG